MTICIAGYTILVYVAFIIKARQWYFIKLTTSKFMVAATNCIYFMIHLLLSNKVFL